MTGFVKKSGSWNQITQPKVKTGGSWKDASKAWVKKGGSWLEWFSAAPATAPTQIADLRITAVRRLTATSIEIDLAWTNQPGVIDYTLDVWNSPNTPVAFWKGTPANGDGSGGTISYQPQQTLTITGAGTYTWAGVIGSGTQPIVGFRLTPRNALGTAPFPSNFPWVCVRTNVADIPLPTPLLVGSMSYAGSATLCTANMTWTAPSANGAWANSVGLVTQYGANFYLGSFAGSNVAAPGVSTPVLNISFPYGVLTAAVYRVDASSQALAGAVHIVPSVGTVRVPFVRSGYPATPYVVTAGTDIYEGGAFPDIGYKFYNQDTNPAIIGSMNPVAVPDGTAVSVIRGGQASCSTRIQYNRTVDGGSIYCMGYGDENELARYVNGTWGTFQDLGSSVAMWTWSNPAKGGVWGLQNGLTYNFYLT